MKVAELLAIKRELTVIKVQIDGLLDCVDKMDRQRKDSSGRDNSLTLFACASVCYWCRVSVLHCTTVQSVWPNLLIGMCNT